MRRLVIAVDCDDVLVPSTHRIVSIYNQMYGTQVTLQNAHIRGNPEWQAERDETLRRIYEIQLTTEYGQTSPFESAMKSVKSLGMKHELHVVTARPERVMGVTMAMISKYFPDLFSSFHHVGHGGGKGDICKLIGADVLFDDNKRHLESAGEYGIPGLLWFGQYPWNKAADSTVAGIVRCVDWNDVGREVHRIADR